MEILKVISEYLKFSICAELTLQGRKITSEVSAQIESVVALFELELVCVGELVFCKKFIEQGRQAGIDGAPICEIINWISQSKCSGIDLNERSKLYPLLFSLKSSGVNSPFIADNETNISEIYVKLCDTYMEKLFNELKNND